MKKRKNKAAQSLAAMRWADATQAEKDAAARTARKSRWTDMSARDRQSKALSASWKARKAKKEAKK